MDSAKGARGPVNRFMNRCRGDFTVAVAAILLFGALGGIGAWYYLMRYRPVADAQERVRALAFDPQAVQFSDMVVDGNTVCGMANAKNRLGGYVGPRGFVAEAGGRVIWDGDPSEQAGGTYSAGSDAQRGRCRLFVTFQFKDGG